MKTQAILLLLLVCSMTAISATRNLTAVSVPDVDIAQGAVNVLFSRLSGDESGTLRVVAHGDTLSVESDGKRRQWFAWRSDTAYYAGEETIFTIEGPRLPVAAFGFPLVPGDRRSNTFMIYGTENKVRDYVRKAIYTSETGGRGSLVLPEGDTVKSVAAVRDILVTVTDSVECRRKTVRWFRSGERLPVAVCIKENESAVCYAIDAYEYRSWDAQDDNTDEEFIAAMKSSVVNVNAGYIDVFVDFPETSSSSVLTIGISDVAGHQFAFEERRASGNVSVRIPTSGLRAGEYIVGLSLSQPGIVEKRYISVRP